MKHFYALLGSLLFTVSLSIAQTPVMTTIVDGDCSGGHPKLLEIYVDGTVDFSLYTLETQINGSTTWSASQDLSSLGVVSNDFVYISTTASESALSSEFPSLSSATVLLSDTMSINGDDRIRIVLSSNGSVVDQFGDSGVDGTGTSWEYRDSYAKRVDGTGADNGFSEINWIIPGYYTLNGEGVCLGGSETIESLIGGIGVYSTTGSNTPNINITGAINTLFYFEGNGPSSPDLFHVSGYNLNDDITITVSNTNFELALSSAGPYASSLTLNQSSGIVNATEIYVRMVAGLSANTYSGNVVISSAGAATETADVGGLVNPSEPLVAIYGELPPMTYNFGNGPSEETTFNVTGSFLEGDVVVSVTDNFEISLNSGGTFTSSITLSESNGSIPNTEFYIRLAAGLDEGNYSGTVSADSPNANDESVNIQGSVFVAGTCANVGDLVITEIMKNPDAVGDYLGEYFEVYNTTNNAIDIIGWTISDYHSDSHTILTNLVIPAQSYAVFGNNSNMAINGGLVLDYVYDDTILGNLSDEVQLKCNSTIIDEVVYDSSVPNIPGVSLELAVTSMDESSNDDFSNWGLATATYGAGDLGTPGRANDFTLSVNTVSLGDFKIYPNPNSTGTVHIMTSSSDDISVTIYDMLGKNVMQTIVSNQGLDVSQLTSGIYMVRLTQGLQSITKKLVIK